MEHAHRRAVAAAIGLAGAILASEARADLRICNVTQSRVGVSVGYRDPQGWVTEGWFNLRAERLRVRVEGRPQLQVLLYPCGRL